MSKIIEFIVKNWPAILLILLILFLVYLAGR
jgi:hypothetical protein